MNITTISSTRENPLRFMAMSFLGRELDMDGLTEIGG